MKEENLQINQDISRRKNIILFLGIFLSFFTSMSKILVPGPIYNHLMQMHFDPAQIASLGACYMYAYATSQLLAGIFSTRYGGVRILLIGGTLFTLGSIGFPLCPGFKGMIFFRIISGLGAGTVFLGIAKLINDLYPQKFALMLGIALFISYLGPVTGTVPVVWLIGQIGWRETLLLSGICSAAAIIGVFTQIRGTIKPTVTGQSIKPFLNMLSRPQMWLLCISTSIIFGIYYVLLTQVGQKCFEDFYHFHKYYASLCITMLALLVACNNIMVSYLLKLTRGKWKGLILGCTVIELAGSILGYISFHWNLPYAGLLTAFLLIAIPAGFFTLYSVAAKELNPPEQTGLSVAVLNFSAFVFIALFGSVSGWIMDHWKTKCINGVFPGGAYVELFLFMSISALISVILAFFLSERGKYAESQK